MRRSRGTITVGTRLRPKRAGLAPMELVLVMPVLMMMAGLMLFAANAGVWKLRAYAAAREVAFQTVHPRQSAPVVPPPDWRRPDLSHSVQPGPNVWNVDPLENHPLLRGPNWPPPAREFPASGWHSRPDVGPGAIGNSLAIVASDASPLPLPARGIRAGRPRVAVRHDGAARSRSPTLPAALGTRFDLRPLSHSALLPQLSGQRPLTLVCR